MNGSSSPTLDARIFRVGPGWFLCRFRLPTSMPIPLAVAAPGDIELSTWAFAGMKAPAHRPTVLLLVRAHGAAASALASGTRLVITTHFHDITVSTGAAEPSDALSPDEGAVMARAVLSSVTATTVVAALADPIALFAPALRAVPVRKEAPDLAIADDRLGSCTLSGTDVPNYILFDSDAGIRCARVAAARMTFAPKPLMNLDLEPVWGPESGMPAGAVLLGDGRFASARLRAAAA